MDWESRLFGLSPLGLLLGGVALGTVAVPGLKKAVHNLAVITTRGVLAVADQVEESTQNLRDGWNELVGEARAETRQTARSTTEN